MDLRDRVGANLRRLRRLQSLSQEALSLRAGLERGYVGRLERSQYYTSMAAVQKLALALEVDPIELIVTSRPVVWLFFEQFWFEFVPVFHGLQGRFAAQG
jgi:transcriptional regulator with XRE-family HTH domain